MTAAYKCNLNRTVKTEGLRTDVTQQRHEKSGTRSVAFSDDGLGGSSMPTAEINNALQEHCDSFDQTRLLRRRLTMAEGSDSNLNPRPRTKAQQEE